MYASNPGNRCRRISSAMTLPPAPSAIPVSGGRLSARTFSFLGEPRRLLAIAILALAGGSVLVFLIVRGELAGGDALAYWAGVRIWLSGGDPMHPGGPYMPFVYAPWT